MMPDQSFSRKGKYIQVFILALFFRSVHFYQIYKSPLLSADYVPDTLAFVIIAEKIMEGNFFFTIPMNMNILYSLYLIPFVLLFQDSIVAAVVGQLILDSLSAVIVYKLAERIFSPREGLLAGLIYAIYASLIWFAGMPLGESLVIFFLLLSCYFLIKAVDNHDQAVYYYLAGVLGGVASLGRPNIIFSFILVALGIFFYNRREKNDYQSPGRYVLGLVLLLLPFSLNNYYLEKTFSPYPAKGGYNFYVGNHHGAKGTYELIPGTSNRPYLYMYEAQEVAARNLLRREVRAKEADAYWFKQGLEFIRAYPVEAGKLLFIKILLFMNNKELATNLDYDFCSGFSSILKYNVIPPGILMALAIMGFIVIPNYDKRVVFLKLMLAGLVVSTVVFFISDRYRIVSLPFVLLLSARYVFILYETICQREKIKILLALFLVIILMVITFLPMSVFNIKTEKTTAFAHAQYGIYLGNINKTEEAVSEFQKAIKLNYLDPEPYYHLSLIYYSQRKYQPAQEYFNKAKMLSGTVDAVYEQSFPKSIVENNK